MPLSKHHPPSILHSDQGSEYPDSLTQWDQLNPQFNYKWRTIDSRPYWSKDYLSDEVAYQLAETGYIRRRQPRRRPAVSTAGALWPAQARDLTRSTGIDCQAILTRWL